MITIKVHRRLCIACLLAILPIWSLTAQACALWEHQWRLLYENREYESTPEVYEMWKAWYQRTYNQEPRPVEIYDLNKNAPDVKIASASHTLLQPSQYEEYEVWKIDDALLPTPVLRWEYLAHAQVRWVSMDAHGKIENIDEAPLYYGWTQTICLWPTACPILAFQRINSLESTNDLFALLTWLLPGSAESTTEVFTR
jgi:hypothetical protein